MRPPPRFRTLAVLAGTGALGAAVALIAELVQWRSSRRGFSGRSRVDGRVSGPDLVLVLGFPSRSRGRRHPMQRWRTDIAVRSMHSEHGLLLFTGAGPVGEPSEAQVMAAYACDVLGVPAQQIAVQTAARTTWQNVAHCLDRLGGAGSISIASAPAHAARARRYLGQQRPDLAERLVPADGYRSGEQWRWKVASAAYEVVLAVRRCLKPRPQT